MSLNADMSLDDIISSNRSSFTARKGSGNQRSRGARRGGTSRFSGNDRRPRQSRTQNYRSDAKKEYVRGNLDDQWSHDLYSEEPNDRVQTSRSQPGRRSSAKLMITNLHFDVTDNDIKELFSPFGTIVKSHVNYDSSGRSKCSAFVEYLNLADATQAKDEYNNVQLDGMPLKIELLSESFHQPQQRSLKRLQDNSGSGSWNRQKADTRTERGNFRDRRGRGRSDFSGRIRGRNDNRRGGNRRETTKQPTSEELDAELDAYIGQAQKMSLD